MQLRRRRRRKRKRRRGRREGVEIKTVRQLKENVSGCIRIRDVCVCVCVCVAGSCGRVLVRKTVTFGAVPSVKGAVGDLFLWGGGGGEGI